MANITLSETPSSVVSGFITNALVGNTNTDVITITFSSASRASGTADAPSSYNIQELDDGATGDHFAEKGFLQGRRPHRGLQFPRGYYNK